MLTVVLEVLLESIKVVKNRVGFRGLVQSSDLSA